MSKLRNLILRVPDPDLRDRLLRQAEREGAVERCPPPPPPPIQRALLRMSPLATVQSLTAAVSTVSGVTSVCVEQVGPNAIRVTVEIYPGYNRAEAAESISRVLYEQLPVTMETRGSMAMTVGDLGTTIRFTMREI